MFDVKPVTSPRRNDCGPTCLKMILDYYGTEIPLEQLIGECGLKYAGCSMGDMKRVGNAHGLNCIPYKMDAEEVVRQDRPSIVWWRYNHFCVCCGLNDAGDVVICNPDRGRFPIDFGSFEAIYSGVAMFNGEPTEEPTE